MNTEEKLKHFLDTCMEDARARSSRMMQEYTAAQEKAFDEHQKEASKKEGSPDVRDKNRKNRYYL